MFSTFSGTVVRTTHVSGMFTDLGIFLGHARLPDLVLRRRSRHKSLIDRERLGDVGTAIDSRPAY